MEQLTNLLFFINVAWLITHELDAIEQHEWQILPLTLWMSERWGYRVFVLAHIPLMVTILAGMDSTVFQVGFDIFLIAHIGLHWLFRHHPLYTFNNGLSLILIGGVAPFALLHLILIAT